MANKAILIKTDNVAEIGTTIMLRNGKQIAISRYDIDFFDKLRSLPAIDKLQLIDISAEDAALYVKRVRLEAKLNAISILQKEWYYRETGEPATIDEIFIKEVDDLKLTLPKILRKCLSKKPPTVEYWRRSGLLPLKLIQRTTVDANTNVHTKH